jgi:rsbT co-antagonist protein RsbR
MEFTKALVSGVEISLEPYAKIRSILETVSVEGARQDLTPSETATFIFSMKDAILPTLLVEYKTENQDEVVGAINRLIDSLGLFTFETFMETKEKLIREQQKSLLEVSAPVVRVWDEILMVPLIGLLDSTRTQLVMETLLDGLERTQSKVAILDISGIPAVDSLVAKHLLTTVSAVRLMGAECIITGISSRISQTMVQIGIDLSGITTKSSMADGLKVAFSMTDKKVVPK